MCTPIVRRSGFFETGLKKLFMINSDVLIDIQTSGSD